MKNRKLIKYPKKIEIITLELRFISTKWTKNKLIQVKIKENKAKYFLSTFEKSLL